MASDELYRKERYLSSMRPILRRDALFSDSSPNFLRPFEPSAYGQVTIRFRTAKNNVDYVFVIVNHDRFLMDKAESIGNF